MKSRSRVRTALQLLGFLVGLAMLGWCIRQALGPENQAQLRRLGDAPASAILLLLSLSLGTLVLNGLMFWVAVRPIRNLSPTGVCATNAVATFASYLPFKLSVVVRVLIHTRRDGLPFFTVGAWMTAVAVVMLVSLSPLALGAYVRGGLDGVAWGLTAATALTAGAAVIVLARLFSGERGLAKVRAAADATRVGLLSRAARSEKTAQLHGALTILGHARATIAGIALRLTDTGVQAWRFLVAADILGIPMSIGEAVILSIVYFLVSVFTPIGVLGSREAATAAVAVALGLRGELRDTDLPLLVTATESLVNLMGAVVGLAILRPRRGEGPASTDPDDGATARSTP